MSVSICIAGQVLCDAFWVNKVFNRIGRVMLYTIDKGPPVLKWSPVASPYLILYYPYKLSWNITLTDLLESIFRWAEAENIPRRLFWKSTYARRLWKYPGNDVCSCASIKTWLMIVWIYLQYGNCSLSFAGARTGTLEWHSMYLTR